jgi:hypothetical protein
MEETLDELAAYFLRKSGVPGVQLVGLTAGAGGLKPWDAIAAADSPTS